MQGIPTRIAIHSASVQFGYDLPNINVALGIAFEQLFITTGVCQITRYRAAHVSGGGEANLVETLFLSGLGFCVFLSVLFDVF